MKLHIEIAMDNAAFKEEGPDIELTRILQDLEPQIPLILWHAPYSVNILDLNGNMVGRAWLER